MKVTISDTGDHRKQARIEVGWEMVRKDYDDLLTEYSMLPVSGFRPGKAPKAMVEKQYESALLEDTGARSVRRLSRVALEKEGIEVTGPISITDISIEPGETLRFTAEFTELPRFDLPSYDSLSLSSGSDEEMRDEISLKLLEKTEVEIPDEMVREELLFGGDDRSGPGDEAWDVARNRVKLLMILGEIAGRDGIEADDREMDERIEQIARAQEMDVLSLRKFMLRNGSMSRLSGFILAEKTLDYLLDINGESN